MQKDFIVIPQSCESDTFTPVLWASTGTDSIAVYDHVISEDIENHSYGSITNSNSLCPQQYFFIQEEISSGVWSDYSGSLVTLDEMARIVTITSSASDLSLD